MCRSSRRTFRQRRAALALVAVLTFGTFLAGTESAVAQGAVLPSDPPCCKPGDPNCTPTEHNSTRVALVVGVDNYGEPNPSADRLTNLKNAGNDARALARILSENSMSFDAFSIRIAILS